MNGLDKTGFEDCTLALMRMLNTKGRVQLEPGTYRVANHFVFPNNSWLCGCPDATQVVLVADTVTNGPSISFEVQSSAYLEGVTLRAADGNEDLDRTHTVLYLNNAQRVTLSNVNVDGKWESGAPAIGTPEANHKNYGVYIRGCHDCDFEKLKSRFHSSYGIQVEGGSFLRFRDCRALQNGQDGVKLLSPTNWLMWRGGESSHNGVWQKAGLGGNGNGFDIAVSGRVTLDGVYATGNSATAFQCKTTGTTDIGNRVANIRILHCTAESNDKNGFGVVHGILDSAPGTDPSRIPPPGNILFSGCFAINCGKAGIHIGAGTAGGNGPVRVSDCVINGSETSGIILMPESRFVHVTGCILNANGANSNRWGIHIEGIGHRISNCLVYANDTQEPESVSKSRYNYYVKNTSDVILSDCQSFNARDADFRFHDLPNVSGGFPDPDLFELRGCTWDTSRAPIHSSS